jgi:hypothetical protein
LHAADGKREALREHLRASEILSGVHYSRIIPDQDALKTILNPTALLIFRRHGALLIVSSRCRSHPFLTNEEVAAVIRPCNEWVRNEEMKIIVFQAAAVS